MKLVKKSWSQFWIACVLFALTMTIYPLITGGEVKWQSVLINTGIFAVLFGIVSLLLNVASDDPEDNQRKR